MYLVYQNQAVPAYSSLYFFIFLSLQFSNVKCFCHTFLRNYEPYKVESRYTCAQCLMYLVYWNQTISAAYSSLYFFIFLSLQFSNINIFVTLFSVTVRPTKLILGTHVDKGLMYCVYQNQTAAAYSSLYFSFLSNFQTLKFSLHFLRNCEAYRLRLGTHMDNGLM